MKSLITVKPDTNIPDPTVYGSGKNYHVYLDLMTATRLDNYQKKHYPNRRARSLILQRALNEWLDMQESK